MKTLPVLYKKTNTGAIQFWEISTRPICECELVKCNGVVSLNFGDDPSHSDADNQEEAGEIIIKYGQLGTDSPQVSSDLVTIGKSLGKKNATTAYNQAVAEAQAKWEKQKKKRYVESIAAAEAGEVDDVIEGGIDPMLAHSYLDVIYDLRPGHEGEKSYEFTSDAKKIKFPVFVQPKLDGIRCLAVIKDGQVTLWSRTRERITSMPHIEEEIRKHFGQLDMTLDGELYNHDFKKDFEKIASAVRKEKPEEGYLNVQYHIYDVANETVPFATRAIWLNKFVGPMQNFLNAFSYLRMVATDTLEKQDEVVPMMEAYVKNGYEGVMLRNKGSMYVGKRSYDLQKAKPFQEEEFTIVGFEEGRGKMKGRLAKWHCKTKAGEMFYPPMNATLDKLEEYFLNGQSYVGKLLTVRYQGYTGKNNVPRFPKGKAIRDYE